MFPDKPLHELPALRIIDDHYLHTPRSHVVFRSPESPILSNDDFWDSIQEHRSAAHITGGQRRVERRAPIIGGLEPARILQAIHFRVEHGASFLDPPIVTAAHDSSINNQYGANRNTSLHEAAPCLLDRRCQEFIHVGKPVAF